MTTARNIKVGLMGFGQTGRQLYHFAANSDDIEISAIADIGDPKILHYLLCSEVAHDERYQLDGNFLRNPRFSSRLMGIDRPAEMPGTCSVLIS
jgi:glyceraldehyde 3-phosphate dehydrogenase